MIIAAPLWDTATSNTTTGADLDALKFFCAAVSESIAALVKPFTVEPLPLTNVILDSPLERDLVLPLRPARSITSIYSRADANALASRFEVGVSTDYLIDNTDNEVYSLLIDDWQNNYSKSGIVRGGSGWWVGHGWPGYTGYRPPERLYHRIEGVRGSILVNYLAGTPTLPAEVQAAAVMAVSMLMERRKKGIAYNSESFGGYSYSAAGPFTAVAAVNSPEVLGMLGDWLTIHIGG